MDALLVSFSESVPVILIDSLKPHPFDFLTNGESFEHLGFPQGSRKLDLYNFLLFNLSVVGLAPFAGEVSSVRSTEIGLDIITESNLVCNVRTSKVRKVEPEVCEQKKIVLDWINVRRGQKHDLCRIKTTSDFVNCVHFYPSERVDGAPASNLKDAVAISYMSDGETLKSNYSEFYVRMKVKALMESEGVRGPKNGKDPKNPDRQKYHSILLESHKREVYPLVTSSIKVPEIYSISPVVSRLPGSRWDLDFRGTMG